MTKENWNKFAEETDRLTNQNGSITKYTENDVLTINQLNSLWDNIRDVIKKCASSHIVNHTSSSTNRPLTPKHLLAIYKDIRTINKIFYRFHANRIKALDFPNTED